MQDWASLHAYLDWAYEGPPGSFTGTYEQAEGIKAWLLLRGSVRLWFAARRVEAHRGHWVIPPLGVIRQEFSTDARILSVRFHATWPNGEDLVRGDQAVIFPARLVPALEVRARRLERAVRRHFPQARIHLLEAPASLGVFLKVGRLFAEWLDAFAGAMASRQQVRLLSAPHDQRVLSVARQIDRWRLDEPFAAPALARRIGLSPSQLDRLFVRDLRVTPRRYFELRRLARARALLASRSPSVKELAYQLGFAQASHFSAWFRRHLGLSPRAFRQAPSSSRLLPGTG